MRLMHHLEHHRGHDAPQNNSCRVPPPQCHAATNVHASEQGSKYIVDMNGAVETQQCIKVRRMVDVHGRLNRCGCGMPISTVHQAPWRARVLPLWRRFLDQQSAAAGRSHPSAHGDAQWQLTLMLVWDSTHLTRLGLPANTCCTNCPCWPCELTTFIRYTGLHQHWFEEVLCRKCPGPRRCTSAASGECSALCTPLLLH